MALCPVWLVRDDTYLQSVWHTKKGTTMTSPHSSIPDITVGTRVKWRGRSGPNDYGIVTHIRTFSTGMWAGLMVRVRVSDDWTFDTPIGQVERIADPT
jgi:hypothetical protein